MTTLTTTTQRFSDASRASWKCFPSSSPYVMPTEQQRTRSQNRNRNRHLSHSYNTAPPQWQEELIRRPATANPAISHDSAHAARPVRSRSRLQKRPSQRALKKSASTSAMSQLASYSQGPSVDRQNITALPQLPDQAVPERRSSLRKNPIGGTEDQSKSRKETTEEPRSTTAGHGLLSIRPKASPISNSQNPDADSEQSPSSDLAQSPTNTATRTPRYQPLAPNDPSPLNPRYHIPASDFFNVTSTDPPQPHVAMQKNDDVLLPPDFRPGKTEHTYVEEVVKPAVTQEVIKHNKTEIVQERITKEIHVHHYYTYTQPIKAVEILPARHFIVDAQTGEKVEIPPPEGWVMPSNLQPYKPDTSNLVVDTRHYLVNEEHPRGIPEPPPSHVRKESSPDLRKKTSLTGRWTPFPKVR